MSQPGSVARVRGQAPPFQAEAVGPNGEFLTVDFPKAYAGKYVVLFFYPLDFTFVCPTEIIEFSDRVDQFRALGCEVVAASVDSKFSHLAWMETPRSSGGLGKMNIPIISDLSHAISKAYGVFVEEASHSLRGSFVIDGHGVIRHATLNDMPVGRSVDETLRLVQAFQHADKYGEVCPSGWKPGDATIQADPKSKLKYFEAKNKQAEKH